MGGAKIEMVRRNKSRCVRVSVIVTVLVLIVAGVIAGVIIGRVTNDGQIGDEEPERNFRDILSPEDLINASLDTLSDIVRADG
jgi:uncharacterized membrane protein YjgN (DUF898 family)